MSTFGAALVGLVAVALVLAAGTGPGVAKAADEPFRIEFDQSEMQIGLLSDLPLGQLASRASIEGTIDDEGNVTVPRGSFQLPEIGISSPVEVRIFMGIENEARGTFDRATGELTLDAKAGVWVSVNLPQLLGALEGLGIDIGDQLGPLSGIVSSVGDLTCGFSPMNVTFTTGSTSLGSGAPFTAGTLGAGALTTEWSELGPFAGRTKIFGLLDACQAIRMYAPDLLGGLLGGALPGGLDLGGIDLEALLENLDNVNLGPSALTLTRTLDENEPPVVTPPRKSPALKLSVKTRKRKVRPGAKAKFVVKVRNTGKGHANRVKLCIRTPAVRVLAGKRCRKLGRVMAGATQTRRFRVKIGQRRTRSLRVRFDLRSANARRATSSSRLMIRR